jgi:hypothetical protein
MSHAHAIPEAPATLKVGGLVRLLALVAVLVGGGALGWAFAGGHAELAWSAYLIGAFFALGLGVFGVAWMAILYLSRGVWSVTMRRVPEAMITWLLPGGALALLVALGAPALYHWADAGAVAGDALLTHKSAFLNLNLFYALVGGVLVLWALFGLWMAGNSRRQDTQGGLALTATNRFLSAVFLIVFALGLSVVSFYLIMSLEAHWFSTMFAVLVFTDVMQTGLAFVAVATGLLVLAGQLKGFVRDDHLHSLGKMLFATTGFWAYIYFCQFLLIWYANLPEETAYFLRRYENGWLPWLLALPMVKFVIPFLLLVPREAKRNAKRLVPLAAWVLAAQFVELYVMVGPALGHGEHAAHAHLPLVELAATAGFFGLFVLVFSFCLGRHGAVPLKDPLLGECLEYHT